MSSKSVDPNSGGCSSTSVPIKSFASYKKSKGKEWNSKVSKTGDKAKKKVPDVVISVGLMEWNEKEQLLKAKRGKKVPLRIHPIASYCTLLEEAEKKWKNFHSNLYESQSYHLLYEDGQKAILLPGSNKEPFILSRYQEEIGKDFKRITVYLCSNHHFQIAEGYFDDEHMGSFETDSDVGWNDVTPSVLENDSMHNDNPTKRPRCNSPINIDLTAVSVDGADAIVQDDSCKPSHLELDQQLASHLEEMYDTEDSVADHENINSSPVDLMDSSSVVKDLAVKVDASGQLFFVVRRGAPLNRVLSIWSREIRKKPASARHVVRVHFSGEQGIDSGAMAMELFTLTIPNIGSVIFPSGKPLDSTSHVQNGTFKACGEIVAASLAQGGPAPCFLEESVYQLLVNPNVPLQELDLYGVGNEAIFAHVGV